MRILIMDVVRAQPEYASVHRWELIRNLAKIGHDIHAMAYKNIEFKGVHTYLLQTKKGQGLRNKLMSQFKHIMLLFKLAMTYRFDILYTRNGLTGVIGSIAKIITRSKLVFELNAISSEEREVIKKHYKMSVFKRIEMALSIRIEMFALKKSDAIIVVTYGIKNYLIKHGISESKVVVIENGANTDLFKPIDDSIVLQRLRKQYINEDDHLIIFVGHLVPWQGVEYLLHAAPLIIEEIQKTKFLIVGDGIMREKLESLTTELNMEHSIIFTGTVPYENVPEYINISDVCVAPFIRTRNESMGLSPLKIYEYLACGKPVVASNIKGVGNLLESSNSGISVIPDNSNELAEAIIKLLKDKQLREQMGDNGRGIVSNNYSWENTAKKTKEVFGDIL